MTQCLVKESKLLKMAWTNFNKYLQLIIVQLVIWLVFFFKFAHLFSDIKSIQIYYYIWVIHFPPICICLHLIRYFSEDVMCRKTFNTLFLMFYFSFTALLLMKYWQYYECYLLGPHRVLSFRASYTGAVILKYTNTF